MTARRARKDRIAAIDRHEPTLSTEAAEPIAPADSAEPTEPIDRTERSDAIDSTESREPIDSTEFCDHSDHFDSGRLTPPFSTTWKTILRACRTGMNATGLLTCRLRAARFTSPATPADTERMSLLSLAGRDRAFVPVTVAADVWLRNAPRTRVGAWIAALWSLAIAGLVFLPGRLPFDAPVAATVLVIAVYFAVAGAGLALAGRVARAGVRVGAEAIVIRGPFRTQVIAVADARRFAPGLQGRGGNGVPCPVLERRSGGQAGVWALGRRNIWFDYARMCAELQPLCDELNALVVPFVRAAAR
jgi:hypothetical protein